LLQIRSRVDQGNLLIDFDDDGVGIAPAALDRIFEPFFTTKAAGDGTGLGLSISFGIIGKHGGSLSVRSTLGLGTCFTVRLPLGASEADEDDDAILRRSFDT
jgi:two-component system NtrC family sensor kinase